MIQLNATVFVNGGYYRLACRKIEIVTIEGIDGHRISRCWFVWNLYLLRPGEPRGNRQPLRRQEVGIEELRLIAIAVVGKDRQDGVAGTEFPGKPNGAGNVDRRRSAEAQSLVFDEIEDVGQGLRIRDAVGEVGRKAFQIRRDPALTDPFGDR